MASLYMRIGTEEVKGAATADYTGGDDMSKQGWFAIKSFSWGAVRSVGMDIGNGMNQDSGMVAMNELSVTKEVCGASESLLSSLYMPGDEGKTIDLICTKPDRSGEGSQVYLQVKLEKARLVSYSVSGSDGGTPFESLAIAYNTIKIKHWHEAEGGKLEPGGLVAYDLPTGKVISGKK
ncbi:type VI secretion system tube protein Hcp [Sansalvadorimonas sp. 2012CJ34-2]|uniref:Type VI secretion system tube protein Hcp n=1 Tax=Parendozoicomonas callyspongiae TaxID=2942213 RepID=A0ABT0PI86_9GAMM|nr:type VI secretion system tube protein Hcp [Sansalvadorimonas sp. 2012CJ34-2]MCL6271100.1 type VI secretion system tube protein Hcp [Sansalvadorimonas sp. 2012CJ34-2]